VKLVLVPTPIGNLEDITLRAIRVLKEVDVVACEDTRRTGILLKHLGISKRMLRLDQHTVSKAKELLSEYEHIAYVTDAGTPGISDPGAELVQLAVAENWSVEVLPGPTALVPAVVASGMPTARFSFEGFLPQKTSERRERLQQVASGRTVVLYEAPHRIQETLKDLAKMLGDTHKVAVIRELSKIHEEIWRGTLAGAIKRFVEPKGEFVLVLAPAQVVADKPNAQALLEQFTKQGLSGKELVKALTTAGIPRNQAYELVHPE
jgi:16S rRNA (cytidine1402-2'-O)-methyltransferase